MRFGAGERVKLEVAREKPPFGFFLHAGDGVDVLLPYAEKIGDLQVGEEVDVFLFHDDKSRVTATMRESLAHYGELACLEVVDANPRLGSFLDIGIGRNLLLPKDEMPEIDELAPQIGDKVYVVVERDKQGRMLARLANEPDLSRKAVRAPADWKNREIEARVYKPMPFGTFAICEAGVLGFGVIGMVHASERTKLLRIGETFTARVAFVREDGRVNLSMRPVKQQGRIDDADLLLEALRERPNGGMPYSDETPADVIQKRFGISKSAFKRALGKLMKDGVVRQEGNWTYLKEEQPATSE